MAFDVLHQRRARAALELRYSALEVEHYVFRLKCLVPAPLWLVRNPGQPCSLKYINIAIKLFNTLVEFL